MNKILLFFVCAFALGAQPLKYTYNQYENPYFRGYGYGAGAVVPIFTPSLYALAHRHESPEAQSKKADIKAFKECAKAYKGDRSCLAILGVRPMAPEKGRALDPKKKQ